MVLTTEYPGPQLPDLKVHSALHLMIRPWNDVQVVDQGVEPPNLGQDRPLKPLQAADIPVEEHARRGYRLSGQRWCQQMNKVTYLAEDTPAMDNPRRSRLAVHSRQIELEGQNANVDGEGRGTAVSLLAKYCSVPSEAVLYDTPTEASLSSISSEHACSPRQTKGGKREILRQPQPI